MKIYDKITDFRVTEPPQQPISFLAAISECAVKGNLLLCIPLPFAW